MDRPTCIASPWSVTTWRSTPESAPAARTARAFRSASASRRCGWNGLRLEVPVHDDGTAIDRHARARLGRAARSVCGGAGAGFSGEGPPRRAVLCAVRLDGADASDRRRAACIEIPLWLWHRLATDPDQPARNGAG